MANKRLASVRRRRSNSATSQHDNEWIVRLDDGRHDDAQYIADVIRGNRLGRKEKSTSDPGKAYGWTKYTDAEQYGIAFCTYGFDATPFAVLRRKQASEQYTSGASRRLGRPKRSSAPRGAALFAEALQQARAVERSGGYGGSRASGPGTNGAIADGIKAAAGILGSPASVMRLRDAGRNVGFFLGGRSGKTIAWTLAKRDFFVTTAAAVKREFKKNYPDGYVMNEFER